MQKFLSLLVFSLFMVCGFPAVSSAYFTTDQQAFTVDGKTAVFTIDFKFGHENHDINIAAISNLTATTQNNDTALEFGVRNEKGNPLNGKITSIVLSDAPIKNGMYTVPKGKSANFTLLIIVAPISTEAHEYESMVTRLPFMFDNVQKLALNPSELQYYKTPSVQLHSPATLTPTK